MHPLYRKKVQKKNVKKAELSQVNFRLFCETTVNNLCTRYYAIDVKIAFPLIYSNNQHKYLRLQLTFFRVVFVCTLKTMCTLLGSSACTLVVYIFFSKISKKKWKKKWMRKAQSHHQRTLIAWKIFKLLTSNGAIIQKYRTRKCNKVQMQRHKQPMNSVCAAKEKNWKKKVQKEIKTNKQIHPLKMMKLINVTAIYLCACTPFFPLVIQRR